MNFTRRHYEVLAKVFLSTRPDVTFHLEGFRQWFKDVAAAAQALALDNEHFDKARFLAACGLSTGEERE